MGKVINFPERGDPQLLNEPNLSEPQARLRNLISLVSACMAIDELYYVMIGVFIKLIEGEYKVAISQATRPTVEISVSWPDD